MMLPPSVLCRLLAGVIGFMLLIVPASAHKVVMSAYAEGTVVEGEVGFSSGDMAVDIVVEVLDDDGKLLGQTKTDADGIFQFTPTKSVPLTFKANLGQGHVAVYRLTAEELPDIKGSETAIPSKKAAVMEVSAKDASVTFPANASGQGIDSDQLTLAVRGALRLETARLESEFGAKVRKAVRPLQKEIAAYKEKNDFQTILGGIGYILGLFGVGFYLMARKERQRAEALLSRSETENE